MNENFYNIQKEQSRIKTCIVTKYFKVWATIVSKYKSNIAFVDLFCGPGKYSEDQTDSTPLIVLKESIKVDQIKDSLISVFNDKNSGFVSNLSSEILKIPGINSLAFQPKITNLEVNDDISSELSFIEKSPVLLFADPWGYKGLSMKLFSSILRVKFSEAIFFFNYQYINKFITTDAVSAHVGALIGMERLEKIRTKVTASMSPKEREEEILNGVRAAFREEGTRYGQTWHTLLYSFKSRFGRRSTHHIVFVTKDSDRGLKIMKEVMASLSSSSNLSVKPLSYNPALSKQPTLFETDINTLSENELGKILLKDFEGQTLSMIEIFNIHHHQYDYFILINYKNSVRSLLDQGRIETSHFDRSHESTILPDKTLVTFP